MLPNHHQTNYAAKMKGKKGIRRILNALHYSWSGICAACEEQGFRQLLWLNLILITLAIALPFSFLHKLLLIFLSPLALIIELLNTAIEAATDHTSTDKHPLAKRAKDTASAALWSYLFLLASIWITSLIHLIP